MQTTHRTDSACEVCGSADLAELQTYKHHWSACSDCLTATRRLRTGYLIPGIVPERIARALLPAKVANQFYPIRDVRESPANFYRHYATLSAASPAATAYRDETRQQLDELAEHGIDAAGRNVLDISGGPGFFARDLAAMAKRVVVTEFSAEAVAGMSAHLGIEAVRFDYNGGDGLSVVAPGPFDVVLIRYSLNFCLDLRRLARQVRRVLTTDGVLYLSFVAPTLGYLLRWQHDEYTALRLYPSETVTRSFTSEGWHLATQYRHPGYGVMENRGVAKNTVLLPFILLYGARSLGSTARISRRLRHENHVHIYRPHNVAARATTTRPA